MPPSRSTSAVLRSWSAGPSPQLAKRNEPPRRFVPEREAHACKALTQTKSADICQTGVLAKNKRQPIKRNSTAQVVDVVHADVGGEPAQHGRQVMFGVGPIYLFILRHRLPFGLAREGLLPWIRTMATNGAIALVVAGVMWWVGVRPFLLVHLPITVVAA